MMSASYYWSVFLRRLPYFLAVVFLITAAAVFVAVKLPPSYVSQMRMIIESPQIPDDLAASTATTPAEEQLQIIEQRLLTRTNLVDIAHQVEVFDNIEDMLPDQIVAAMNARTTIRSSAGRNQASLMTVSFEASTGQRAAGVLNEYLTIIQQEDIESRTGRATQTLIFFEQEVARLSEVLAERSAAILDFKTQNAEVLPDSLDYRLNQRKLLQERLLPIEREIGELEQQRNRVVQLFETTGDVAQVETDIQTPEQQQLQVLRAQLNEALAVYSPENPRVVLLQARIARVEEVISSRPPVETDEEDDPDKTGNLLLDVQLGELEARQKVLREQKAAILGEIDELNSSILLTPQKSIQLDELELNYRNVQNQYNTAVEALSRASTGERIELMARGQRISVIEPPAVPSRPTKPNRKLIAGGGMLFGIIAGLGVVVLLELLNRTIRRPEDIVSKLGIVPIATIPYMKTKSERWRSTLYRTFWILMIVIGVPVGIYAVHTYYQPLDLIFESVLARLGIRL